MSVFILLDRSQDNNDKKWLVEGLQQQCEQPVNPIYSRFTLSVMARKGPLGKLRVYMEVISQSIRLLRKSKKNDIIICWFTLSIHILYPLAWLFRCKRYYLAMNWISPQANSRLNWLKKRIVKNKMSKIIVNTPELIVSWEKILHHGRTEAFYCIPDVYDTRVSWREKTSHKKHHFFTGGMNNRDWRLISDLASKYPKINFVCCALKDDFNKKVKNVLPNMIVHFNIGATEYYKLLSESYAVLLPLCTKAVSGLINIIRSAQEGVLCLTSDTPATRQYYDYSNKDLLLPFDRTTWEAKIKEILDMSEEEMSNRCRHFSSYIKNEYFT